MCLRFQPRADFAIFSGLMFLVGAGVTCTSEAVGGRDIGRMIKSGDLATVRRCVARAAATSAG